LSLFSFFVLSLQRKCNQRQDTENKHCFKVETS